MKKAIVNAALVITSVLVISCSSGSAGGDDSTGGTTDLAEASELRIYNWGDRSVTLAWKDPAGVNLAHIEITSPSLTAAVKAAKGAERGVVTLPKNNVIYTLTVQAVDTNQNKTAGKTLMVLSEAPLKRMNTYAADELQYYSTYDYDSEGFVEKELHYDGSDQLINTVIWNYDAQRHCIGFHAYNADDTLRVHEVRELFVEGWWTKISYYDGQGILTEYSVFVRLADGRIDTQSDFDSSGGLQSSVRWQYDSQGRMTKVSFFHPDGTPNGYNAFTYDTEGFETAEKFYNSADVLNYASIYEYDGTTGNRTKTTFYTYSGGNPSPGGYDTYEYAEAPSADS